MKIDLGLYLNKNHFCLLESRSAGAPYSQYKNLMGYADMAHDSSFDSLNHRQQCFRFGHLSYDLKNQFEDLQSSHPDLIPFPDFSFFKAQETFQNFNYTHPKEPLKIRLENLQADFSREEYLETVQKLKHQIQIGNIYEITFCIQFSADCTLNSPFELYQKLCEISPAPFSGYYKHGHCHLMCASPERFLMKKGSKVVTQPIKGTDKRGQTPEEDLKIIQQLKNNEKERAENVMIVDLSRNDLSHFARKGTVCVEELFGIYSFEQVHQMISTVSCEVDENVKFTDLIKGIFPPGSMTGAPKISAMKLIEQFEKHKRGLYSGSIGYIDPSGDFDFNVVIRSLLYNDKTQKLSFSVGSAITSMCNPENEYEECLLKAKSMLLAIQDSVQ